MKCASVCVQRPRCPCPLRCPPAASKLWLTAPPPSGSAGRSRGSATCASSTTRCAAALPGQPTRRWCPTTPGQTPKPSGSEVQLSGGEGTLRAGVFVCRSAAQEILLGALKPFTRYELAVQSNGMDVVGPFSDTVEEATLSDRKSQSVQAIFLFLSYHWTSRFLFLFPHIFLFF